MISDQISTQNAMLNDSINRRFAELTNGLNVSQNELNMFINAANMKNYQQLSDDMMKYWQHVRKILQGYRDNFFLPYNFRGPYYGYQNLNNRTISETDTHDITAHAAIQDTIEQENNPNVRMIDNKDTRSIQNIRTQLLNLLSKLKYYIDRVPQSSEFLKTIGRTVGFNKFFYAYRHRSDLYQGTLFEEFFSLIEQEQSFDETYAKNVIEAFSHVNPTTVDEQYANYINNMFAQQLNI